MTKPTQTQVEALEECANDLEAMINDFYDGTLDYPSQKRKYKRDMETVIKARETIAALTAAAEDNQHSKMFDYISGKATGRVAELEAQLEHMMAYCVAASDVDMAVAATIERCAQWLKDEALALRSQVSGGDGSEPQWIEAKALDRAAAAIRALKDKP